MCIQNTSIFLISGCHCHNWRFHWRHKHSRTLVPWIFRFDLQLSPFDACLSCICSVPITFRYVFVLLHFITLMICTISRKGTQFSSQWSINLFWPEMQNCTVAISLLLCIVSRFWPWLFQKYNVFHLLFT